MFRAYSVLEVKAFEDDARIIRGLATTPDPDRIGDVIEPEGVTFKNPMPLLLHHDSRAPVGVASFAKPCQAGVEFEATLPRVEDDGPLKARVDTAWAEIRAGLIRAVSIGFRALEDGIEPLKSGGRRFLKTEVLELSLVTIPANAGAVITLVKSFDQRAASGAEPQRPPQPAALRQVHLAGVSAKQQFIIRDIKRV